MKRIDILHFTVIMILFATIACNQTEEQNTDNSNAESKVQTTDNLSVADDGKDTTSSSGSGDSFIDSRDGQTYRTIKFGNQIWMAENLNFKMDSSKCFNEEDENCERYGMLYTYEDAMKACPEGFHLPSDVEWDYLIDFNGGSDNAGKNLQVGGNSGFDVVIGGFREWSKDKHFYEREKQGLFWSSIESDAYNIFVYGFRKYEKKVTKNKFDRRYLFSCRCVKD